MLRVVVLVSGGGTNLAAILDAIERGGISDTEVSLVLSNNAGAYALTRARERGIPAECLSPGAYDTREAFHKALYQRLKEASPDLIVLAGYLVAIPPEIVEAFPNQIINIHPSLIPSFCGTGYYGLKVHEAALARGVRITGATVHFVDAGTDTGPILLQKAVEVQEGDTPKSLQRRVMEEAEWKILPAAIDRIARGLVKVENGKVRLLDECTEDAQ
ncbi:MAG: phosphoribosylglycinamide formyltransferase [Blautia sp.]|nr:phosphoribosylglycinamide formyltransferase [Blautia sp.]